MQVIDVMTPDVECTRPGATLREAAQRMSDLDVGPLPVCGDDGRLIGMLTDRDIAVRAIAEGRDPDIALVGDAMTPDVVYCYQDDDVTEAARLMQAHQIRRLVVLDGNRRLTGIVSLGDLAVQTGDDRLSGDTLEAVSEPVSSNRAGK